MPTRKDVLAGMAAFGAAALAVRRTPAAAQASGAAGAGETVEIAEFVAGASWATLPPELVELSKKHVLDALGLALAGQRAETGPIVRRYLAEMGFGQAGAS